MENFKVYTFHCDCCTNYCSLEWENENPPIHCMADGKPFDTDDNGWYLVSEEDLSEI